ncbi:MAG TPA: D-tyrosyl-tRNA(Tyr) deacylase [Deltaproteobacteria bacterium]|nr:D-tyrosyl-tRNA(Tyr) deacylase [Deltaproteobacteria bacterium]
MRAVVQRVSQAAIRVEGGLVAEMGAGLVALVGVARQDGPTQACELAERLVHLRVFPDAQGRMNRSLLDTGGTLGVVSQFTLMGDARKGRRPAFTAAAAAPQAEPLVEALASAARGLGASVVTGRFGAQMQVSLVNEGPVTILLDTERAF